MVKWRFETHCYGPRDCPRYKAGPAYRVPGRKPGMVYMDDDVEKSAARELNSERRTFPSVLH